MLKRSYLFLQGVSSPFFPALADRLVAQGHAVFKVNFNGGDAAYWGRRPAASFRGDLEALEGFLSDIYRRHGITDQILFGDRRPVHRPAVNRAATCGVRTHVFEEGYFRPHWITLEREGVNGHSLLPRDPDWFRAAAEYLPPQREVQSFPGPFWLRAAHDVCYHGAGLLNPVLYPAYQTHGPVTAPVEYWGFVTHMLRVRARRQQDAALIEDLVRQRCPYYVLPLQLNSDAQIRDHSRFTDMREVMDHVLASFARHAPSASRLVVKNHPLDTGLSRHDKVLKALARQYDLLDRVDYLESGNLEYLLDHARGLVTVNSTVGGVGLGLACPTLALSDPIYNLPGLTYQGALDDFWTQAEPPEPALFAAYRDVVMYATQINGGFYSPQGIALAVQGAAQVLGAQTSPLEFLMGSARSL
ncbi:MAG: capsule biosynthesis protein [Zoogloea sp.]|uniref:capsule biosynthesis protein n=1 Tax=Zoogloea sp. TaxID=49181 RepID=UPI003F3EBC24